MDPRTATLQRSESRGDQGRRAEGLQPAVLVAEVAAGGEDHRHAGLRRRPRSPRRRASEPPGWMIAVTPACDRRARGRPRTGRRRRDAITAPVELEVRARLLDRDPHRIDAAHLAGADADRGEVLRRARSRSSARACRPARRTAGRPTRSSVGLRSVTTSISSRASRSAVAVLHEQAAAHAPHVVLADAAASRRSWSSRMRMFGFCLQDLERVLVVARARTRSSTKISFRRSASAASTRRLKHDDAAVGAHRVAWRARARRRRSSVSPTATPQGLLCLMIAAAGQLELASSRRPESRSSRLLNDSSLPWSFDDPSTAGACASRPARSRPRAGAGSRRRRGRAPSRTRAT